jgi:hypothetical protein
MFQAQGHPAPRNRMTSRQPPGTKPGQDQDLPGPHTSPRTRTQTPHPPQDQDQDQDSDLTSAPGPGPGPGPIPIIATRFLNYIESPKLKSNLVSFFFLYFSSLVFPLHFLILHRATQTRKTPLFFYYIEPHKPGNFFFISRHKL